MVKHKHVMETQLVLPCSTGLEILSMVVSLTPLGLGQ